MQFKWLCMGCLAKKRAIHTGICHLWGTGNQITNVRKCFHCVYSFNFCSLEFKLASKWFSSWILSLAVFRSELAWVTKLNFPVDSAFKQSSSAVSLRDFISVSTLRFFFLISSIFSSKDFRFDCCCWVFFFLLSSSRYFLYLCLES